MASTTLLRSGGNPVACASAARRFECPSRRGVSTKALEDGNVFKIKIAELQGCIPLIGDVRGSVFSWHQFVRNEKR
jgi:4-aminobutyrate aminotransferase-like enzyme